jgi:hypothetical protein
VKAPQTWGFLVSSSLQCVQRAQVWNRFWNNQDVKEDNFVVCRGNTGDRRLGIGRPSTPRGTATSVHVIAQDGLATPTY